LIARATWSVAEVDTAQVENLARDLGISHPVARCLVLRGLCDAPGVRSFLDPRLADLSRPDGMADLDVAADRAARAVIHGERVGVFGDYDVDGVTSAALVTGFLNELGAATETVVADRFSGGYGLGAEVVDRLVSAGCRLIIALDCGSSDHRAVERAAELGVDVVIVDHHRVEAPLPKVVACINPQREDCAFADKTMAAVGLAFYFVAAVRNALERRRHIERKAVDPRSFLDLVALGTVADVMPLVGNNRILVSHGLRQMSTSPRPGLTALLRTARIRSRKIRTDHIAYQLAPRLNAAGRVASAEDALALLLTRDARQASLLAERLEQLTVQRRTVEEKVTIEARREAEEALRDDPPVIVVAGDGWHRGVIGIVAARLAEEFGRPAFVVGFDGDVGTGSARAQGQLNLFATLNACAGEFVRFGGHGDAAGFVVTREGYAKAARAIADHARSTAVPPKVRELVCDASISARQLNAAMLGELERIGPFGNGNPEPVFEITGLDVLDGRVVGGSHLKLELKTPTGTVSAFGPRMGKIAEHLPPLVRVAATISADEWRGGDVPGLRLVSSPIAEICS
jgi:single-stranded-DNA-specific exonuclease